MRGTRWYFLAPIHCVTFSRVNRFTLSGINISTWFNRITGLSILSLRFSEMKTHKSIYFIGKAEWWGEGEGECTNQCWAEWKPESRSQGLNQLSHVGNADLSTWAIINCLPESAFAGNKNYKKSSDTNQDSSVRDVGIPRSVLNAKASNQDT